VAVESTPCRADPGRAHWRPSGRRLRHDVLAKAFDASSCAAAARPEDRTTLRSKAIREPRASGTRPITVSRSHMSAASASRSRSSAAMARLVASSAVPGLPGAQGVGRVAPGEGPNRVRLAPSADDRGFDFACGRRGPSQARGRVGDPGFTRLYSNCHALRSSPSGRSVVSYHVANTSRMMRSYSPLATALQLGGAHGASGGSRACTSFSRRRGLRRSRYSWVAV
jgi:hypothetical protein